MNLAELEQSGHIIFEGIVGSQAYGISTPKSDVDTKGVYIQPMDDILGFGYQEQISDAKNDRTFYEIRRFLQLLQTANPTVLELLHLPEDCVTYKHPIMDQVLEHRSRFITKVCKNSFGGYAVEQIKKARGLNKKIVQPPKMERKGVIDFCYVLVNYSSVALGSFLEEQQIPEAECGLVKIPHARDMYALFHNKNGNYRGIVSPDGNDVKVTSVPSGETAIASITFNKDAYSLHCKEYKEWVEWDKNKNPERFSDNMLHGKGYDGKNLAHCHRLLDTALEIGLGRGINVRRPNREQLLAIRRGEYDYDQLVQEAEAKIRDMDNIFLVSDLPDSLEKGFVDQLLVKIRREYYNI